MLELEGEANKCIMMFGDGNTTFSITDRTSTERIIEDKEKSNNTIKELDLIDKRDYSIQENRIYLLFKCSKVVTKLGHILGYEKNFPA